MINNRDKVVLKAFGEHLRQIRASKGLSQQKLGLLADISKNQIGNIERGEVNVTLITSLAIAKALEISLSELYQIELQ
ncbi:MAG: helix-turn-helix domain-containing protein [Daejeonella sp.]